MKISLYFHIPFCTKKCDYCHFYVIPDKEPFKKKLIKGYTLELKQWGPLLKGKDIVSIYFGGGTPSLLGSQYIKDILNAIQSFQSFDGNKIEITLEANPENISLELMREYAESGINRASIGIQSLDDHQLKVLGRIHNASKAENSIFLTAEAGIENISIDLMYDLPGQNLQTWEKTLKRVKQLPIQHLSLYNLVIEPHTVFYKQRQTLQKHLPSEEISLKMYEMAGKYLDEAGLKQYEISAFAKCEKISNHNVGYWTGRPFLGFGPSAFSYWEGKRFRNISNLNRYYQALEEGKSPIDFEEKLSTEASCRELLAIRLRLLSGVNLIEFTQQYGPLDRETLNTIEKLRRENYLKSDKDILQLTKKGILFYDTVATEII